VIGESVTARQKSKPDGRAIPVGKRFDIESGDKKSGAYYAVRKLLEIGRNYAPPSGRRGHARQNHPNRLIVKQECIAVTGTIVDATATQNKKRPDGVRHEPDGDTHGWLKLDTGFENLLNAGNMTDEGGNLVFEIICKFPVTQVDAQAACQGYADHVNLPAVGSHVQVVGRYVQDTFHVKWNEIHPVTSITVVF